MGGNCNSSPISGCTDSQTLEQIALLTSTIEDRLNAIIAKKEQIVLDIAECNESNNEKLQDIIDKFQTLINNDCCEEIVDNLQRIVDLLEDLIYEEPPTTVYEPTTSTQEQEPTTTVEPEPTTSTQAPEETTTVEPEPTTTTVEQPTSGTFYVGNIQQFLCLEDALEEMTLYYLGTYGAGTTLYTNFVGGSVLAGFLYVKKENDLNVRHVNINTGLVGSVAYVCED